MVYLTKLRYLVLAISIFYEPGSRNHPNCQSTLNSIFTKQSNIYLNNETCRKNKLISTMLEIGLSKIGKKYKAHVLEYDEEGCNLDNLFEFDCVTFIETSLALGILQNCNIQNEITYETLIKKLRYKNGNVNGYLSRNHYFSDWIIENEKQGIVRNVSKDLNGILYCKNINFMSNNLKLYPQIKNKEMVKQLIAIEHSITDNDKYYIPKSNLSQIQNKINNGDILAFTSNRVGLDVSHVGFAYLIKSEIHLLHASQKSKIVTISQENLLEYVNKSRDITGLIVARVNYK